MSDTLGFWLARNCPAAWATLSTAAPWSSPSPPGPATTMASLSPKTFWSRASRSGRREARGTISIRTRPSSRASESRRLTCQRVRPSSRAISPCVCSSP